MLQSFTFDSAIPRVVFGVVGLDVLAAETASLGVCAPLLVTTRRGAAKWTSFPDSSPFAIAGLYDGAEVHTPVNVTEDALRYARSVRVGLEKASTISIPCETPGEQADVGDGYPGFC